MNNEQTDAKRRILIFSLAYYPQVGGAEVALKELTDRVRSCEFHIITLNFGAQPKQERIGRVQVHRVGTGNSYVQKILFIPRAVLLARKLHRAQPFDAFWAMMSYMLFPIVLLRFAGINVPYLLTLQEGDPWQHMFNRWFILPFRPLLALGFKNASAVQVISTYLGQWATRMGHHGRVEIIPNGVDLTHFEGMKTPHEGTVLISASRLVHKNAMDVVIRALPLLPASVRLVIAGSGEEDRALKKLAKQLGIYERVTFLGAVEHAHLPSHLHAADIFVRPSRSEGMGNAFIEAMAAGLPVIGTREGGIADFLFDGKTGWVVEKDRPEHIAEAVQDIVEQPEKRSRIMENAKKLVREKYDWDDIAKRMNVLLENVCRIK